MKMRFTDVHKWNKRWFRDLSPNAKLLLLYLYDACGDAGVIEIDPSKYQFETGIKLDEEPNALDELLETDKLKHLDARYYVLPKFIAFQYPKGLKQNYNPHKGVWREIERHNINLETIGVLSLEQGLSKDTKDKYKDKDKDKFKIRIKAIWEKATKNKISPRLHIDDTRLKALTKLLDAYTPLQIVSAWRQASESDFLTNRDGDNRNNWQATFNWICKPANFAKVYEGNYNNNKKGMDYENEGF